MPEMHLLSATRGLVSLVQRTAVPVYPWFIGAALADGLRLSGLIGERDRTPGWLLLPAGVLTVWLYRRHRARFGWVRQPRPAPGLVFSAAAVFFLFLILTASGAIPVPPGTLLFVTFGALLAGMAFAGEWRVSLHWLLPVLALWWVAIIPLASPPAVVGPHISGFVVSSAMAIASLIDHILLERTAGAARRAVLEVG